MSGAELNGLDKVLNELEGKLGKTKRGVVIDEGLFKGAEELKKEIQRNFEHFKDLGYSIEEVTVSDPFWDGDVRKVKIYWKGPHGRYRIIHLNEWGTIKEPNPRGKGAIARSMNNSKEDYRNAIKEVLERDI